MATVTLKLFSTLSNLLPPEARANACTLTVADGTTVTAIIETARLPPAMCHLVLLNGVFVAPSQRAAATVADGDTLAIWPPVAGG